MKLAFNHILIGLVCLSIISCVSSDKPSGDRKPVPIREVASYLNSNIVKNDHEYLAPLKFLADLNDHKKFSAKTGIKIVFEKGVKYYNSDTNKDGKVDISTGFRNGNIVILKTDRNFDGKFDRFEVRNYSNSKIRYDDDFDGSIDRVSTFKIKSPGKAIKRVLHIKTKKSYEYPLMVYESDTEGKVCTGCEQGFRDAVQDFRSLEAKKKKKREWAYNAVINDVSNYESIQGYENKYIKLDAGLWLSESCADVGNRLALKVSDAINNYFDCMKDWKDNSDTESKSRNASKMMQALVGKVSDPDKPLKIHCHYEKEGNLVGWAISSKKSQNPTEIAERDAINSFVINWSIIENDRTEQQDELILHEITHLLTHSHGVGVDKFNSCPALCLGRRSLGSKNPPDESEWNNIKPKLEKLCLADSDINENSSTNLDPEDYSYLMDLFTVHNAHGGSIYTVGEFTNQLALETASTTEKTLIPIQKLPINRKMELATKFIQGRTGEKESIARELVLSYQGDKINSDSMLIPALFLDKKPITRKRVQGLLQRAQELDATKEIIENLNRILEVAY